MAGRESVTFSFQAVVRGRLTVHKDTLGPSATDDARERIVMVVTEMARPGTGPLVFENVVAGQIIFEEEGEDITRAGRGLGPKSGERG